MRYPITLNLLSDGDIAYCIYSSNELLTLYITIYTSNPFYYNYIYGFNKQGFRIKLPETRGLDKLYLKIAEDYFDNIEAYQTEVKKLLVKRML